MTFGSYLLSSISKSEIYFFQYLYSTDRQRQVVVILKIYNSVLDHLGATHFMTLCGPYFGNHWYKNMKKYFWPGFLVKYLEMIHSLFKACEPCLLQMAILSSKVKLLVAQGFYVRQNTIMQLIVPYFSDHKAQYQTLNVSWSFVIHKAHRVIRRFKWSKI